MSYNFQVLVPKDDNLMGKMVEVDITSSGKHYLMSELVTETQVKRPENVPPPLKKGQVSGTTQVEPLKTEGAAPEFQGHPEWVQISVIIVIVAITLKILISVFSS